MSKNDKALRRLKNAQQDTMHHAYWVKMMNDTNTNYYAAISAFDLFWKDKEKPVRDEDNEGQDIYGDDTTQQMKYGDYVFQYKQFLHWKEVNKNLVKPDGKVMTPFEIQKIIQSIRE